LFQIFALGILRAYTTWGLWVDSIPSRQTPTVFAETWKFGNQQTTRQVGLGNGVRPIPEPTQSGIPGCHNCQLANCLQNTQIVGKLTLHKRDTFYSKQNYRRSWELLLRCLQKARDKSITGSRHTQ
jgi:hypothetical protein